MVSDGGESCVFMGGRGAGGVQGFWLPADLATVVPGGGACLLCCPPTLPLVDFSAPIPPTPFPSGEGGDLRLFYARGFAPCIPGAERDAALAEPAVQETEGGRGDFGRLPTLPLWYPAGGSGGQSPADLAFSLLLCPHPPDPLPLRGRGRLKVILCKGRSPLHPRGCTRAALAKLWATVCLRSCGEPQASRRRALVRLSL